VRVNETIRGVGTTARVAATAAPYVRRVMTDDELHDALRSLVGGANDLVQHVSGGSVRDALTDQAVRGDIARIVESLQHGAERVTAKPRRSLARRMLRVIVIVAAIGTGLAVGALLYPRSRAALTRSFRRSGDQASATVGDVRDTAPDAVHDAVERASKAADDLRDTVGEKAQDVRDATGEETDEERETG
jgi:hypothetical protein